MSLDRYCEQFAHLKRAPNRIFPALTKHKAPHKPFLLLAVIDMVGRGQIVNRFVSIIGELTELTMLFTNYWRSLMPAVQTSSIAFPFSRLNSEPFWELVPLPEKEITQAAVNSISTVSQLRQLALGANLDEELFVLMTQEKSRAKLINAILQACFSEEGCRILVREMGIQQQAFQYSNQWC